MKRTREPFAEGGSLPPLVLEEIQPLGPRYVTLGGLEQAIMLVADGRVKTAIDALSKRETSLGGWSWTWGRVVNVDL